MREVREGIRNEFLLDLFIFCLGTVMVSLFYMDTLILTALLIAVFIVALKLWYRKHEIYFFVTGAILGPIAEIICIHLGVWQYANPTLLGIPLWLPITWGLACVLIKRFSELLIALNK